MLKVKTTRMRRMGKMVAIRTGPTDLPVQFTDPLTDFLASHNISAAQIRSDADARRRQAAAQNAAEDENGNGESSAAGEQSTRSRRRSGLNDDDEKVSKRKREEQKKIEKIKESKAFKKRKKHAVDSEDDDEIARAIFEERSGPVPGQMENCAICDKRFTVTPYSVAGPNGGLLCAPCGREVAKERQGVPKKKPKKQTGVGGVGRRRAIQSRILDGDVGTKSLATLCVQTLAKNVDLADSLGDLPDHLIDKIARMFSKRRLLKSETLPLFVQPATENLHIYDGAKLGEQDYVSIFQTAPKLQHLKIRCGIQFKDEVMDYLLSRDTALESFYLHGANLLSEAKWHEFFQAKGKPLKGLQVYYTDNHFGDESVAMLRDHCPNLQRLKIENNQKLTNEGVKTIAELSALEHIGLQLLNTTQSDAYVKLISENGAKLQTLSLRVVPEIDDEVLRAIHDHCRSLTKLRITDSEHMTDNGFVELFTNWANPPLHFVDLQKCRQIDASRPRENPDNVGFCGEGFKALMAHSGYKLQYLNIHACRHITREAFEEVFHKDAHYPDLKELEISFCEEVTDFILGSIFRACPNIREVNVFGCMKVKNVRVPRGVILVGVPNAQGMVVEGSHD
ncbi:UV-damaged DNA-binding protein rad7 [Fusarium torreyae]|uniref:UV-damaged DNA-binding protein rad7 n=1 Tax=Fusarium torreyae TaxID=1237075 RepID=A0A9W8RX79_9HYPO|nr:UV-damaged DNA-binding protein rad7 [Fusarium torreyae]